jgi:hypothetical protein
MVAYQPDSPSRMCAGSLNEAARTVDRSWSLSLNWGVPQTLRTYTCVPLKHPHPPIYTPRRHFGPRVAHCPEATHVCIVRAPVPAPHTHVPASPHTLTHPLTSHLSLA